MFSWKFPSEGKKGRNHVFMEISLLERGKKNPCFEGNFPWEKREEKSPLLRKGKMALPGRPFAPPLRTPANSTTATNICNKRVIA
jgi:hypothetical protein